MYRDSTQWEKTAIWITLPLITFLFSCSLSPENKPLDESFKVINDENVLNERFHELNKEVKIDSSKGQYRSTGKFKAGKKFRLNLIASIDAPVINGKEVQATMVSIHSGSVRSVISYNVQGPTYAGAVDVLKIKTTGLGTESSIKSSINYSGADVNAAYAHANRIWAALASDDPEFSNVDSSSALQSFSFNGFKIDELTEQKALLPSYASNSVISFGDRIFATSGDDGGLSILNEGLKENLGFVSMSDARWVDVNDEYLVVLQGDTSSQNEGNINIIDPETFETTKSYTFSGGNTPQAKNTVEVHKHLAFIAAGKEGVKVMDLTTGEIKAHIPRPDPAENGLSDEAVETNAVSVDDDKIFISNGGAGVYVAEMDKDVKKYDPGDDVQVSVIGQLQFDDVSSVNHIAYRSKVLVVAAGKGGVKVISLKD